MGTTYYFANAGANANSGLSALLPKQTAAGAGGYNGLSLSGDDQVLFNRGDTWRELFTVPSSGSSGHPIIHDAYGSGAAPVISGGSLVTSWSVVPSAPSVIQRVLGTNPDTATRSVAITPTAGNALIVIGYIDNQNVTIPTIADTKGNTWTIGASNRNQNRPADYGAAAQFWMATAFNVAGGATTITATYGGAQNALLEVYEISGVASVQTAAATHPVGATSYADCSITTTGTTLVFGAIAVRNSAATTVQAGYTKTSTISVDGVAFGCSAYNASAVAGTQTITWTTSASTNSPGEGILAFTASGGSSGIYSASLTSSPSMVTSGTTRLIKGSSATALTAGQWWWASNVLYVRLSGDVDPTGSTIEAAVRHCIDSTGRTDIWVRNLTLRHGLEQAVKGGSGAHRGRVENCTIKYCGYVTNGGAILFYNAVGCRVTGCTIDTVENDGVWAGGGVAGIEIDHNTITNVFGSLSDGVQIDNSDSSDNSGWWFHDNSIDMSGSDSGKGCFITGGPANGSTASICERNTLIGGNYGIGLSSNNTTVRYNDMSGQVSAFGGPIHVDSGMATIDNVSIYRNLLRDSTRAGIIVQDSANNRTNWTIAHNTLVNCAWTPLYFGSPMSGVCKNNIVYWTVQPTFLAMSFLSVVSAASWVSDYNLFRGDFTGAYRYGGTTYNTLAAYVAGKSQDAHSVLGDPLFVNAAGGNYRLKAGSPALKAGSAVSGISSGRPDLGRYQRSRGSPSRFLLLGVR